MQCNTALFDQSHIQRIHPNTQNNKYIELHTGNLYLILLLRESATLEDHIFILDTENLYFTSLLNSNISEELSNVCTYLGDCDCCNCRRRASTIAAPSTIDSSDSLFALSNRFSDSIELSWQSQAVPTSPSHFSDSESWITSDSKDIEVPHQHNESFPSIFVESKSFSVDEELDLDQHWLTESSNISKSYDDLDSQCLSDGEHIFNQPLSESGGLSIGNGESQCSNDYFGTPYPKLVDACFSNTETQPSIYFKDELPSAAGVLSFSDTETQLPSVVDGLPSLKLLETSFSDAETQAPAGFVYGLPLASDEPSFSDAETQWPTDFEGGILRFQSLVSERDEDSDTDCSSHSVSLIKFKKMK
ncbi:unnamed protein product [Mytilus coruscus]|uniref:Uncharacterized protein n=1 Tax=Mytilus coruscus TaxID=42192 RepID=A0A6J8AQB1_MYTCO|nr:unnamed protein product [Mytilus coruscus]